MRQSIVVIYIGLMMLGCRPLGFPMVARLEPDQQAEIDASWNNMLKPVHRLDRETLLDCVVLQQLYQHGVDRFSARSSKKTAAGMVEMCIEFDRSKPQADQFVLRIVGQWGKKLREEKWSAKELFAAYNLDEDGRNASTARDDAAEAKMGLRLKRFYAATQPAQ